MTASSKVPFAIVLTTCIVACSAEPADNPPGSGTAETGGASPGGSPGNGGVANGGTNDGGAANGGSSSGGSNAGGATGDGGTSSGGSSNGGAGGAVSGGGPSNGGAAAGGSGNGGAGGAAVKFVGNITTSGAVRSDFANYWNQLTPENEGKWGSIEGTRDTMNWNKLDEEFQYAKDHGFAYKEHTLVWGSQYPSWITSLSAGEQAVEIEEWIRLFCERYPDVPLIDVVNEPDHTLPPFIDAIGGKGSTGHDWVIWSFQKARQYCPNSTLILNDYNVFRWDTDKFIAIANQVKAAGYLDAVGEQAHGLETQALSELQANLAKVVAVGVPIYVTEYDVNIADDNQQKTVMEQQFTVFWNSPAIVGITLWGYVYGSTWKPDTGLLRGTTPRPALTWLMSYLGR